MSEKKRHILSLLLENTPGALSRVVGLFSQRGYNIESLSVAPTEESSLSRLTLVTYCDDERMEHICKHIHRLIEVIKVTELTATSYIEQELVLLKIHAPSEEQRAELNRNVAIFGGQILEVGNDYYTIRLNGTSNKIENFLKIFDKTALLEVVSSGPVGIAQGRKGLTL